MRFSFFLLCLSFLINPIQAQTSLKGIDLQMGEYSVGFRHYIKTDPSRSYRIHTEFNQQFAERIIPISIWYPAKAPESDAKPLTVLNYLEVLKEEEEWENLPNKYLLDWFPYLWNTEENRKHLPEEANAFKDLDFLPEKFPVVVYGASFQASSIENFALAEYLASHGFIVISAPSRGTETRWLDGGTTKDMETQSRDLEFLLTEIRKYKQADLTNIGLMGFSFGGLSSALTVMKNPNIKAFISLDGTERYNYGVLENSPYFRLDNFDIPYVHFAQKIIPEEVMQKEGMPAELNYEFRLMDSLSFSTIHSYRFNDLSHSYFSSYGVLFANRDTRQDKPDDQIMRSYRFLAEHSLAYLNSFLKSDEQANEFINRQPEANGYPEGLISLKKKEAQTNPYTYLDFMNEAYLANYDNLVSLYEKRKKEHPDLELNEGMLNTHGLRLMFDPARVDQSIKVFLLALHIYPNSANLYDSLGEAYLLNDDVDSAMVSFKKSLELNPENENAINRIKEFGEL